MIEVYPIKPPVFEYTEEPINIPRANFDAKCDHAFFLTYRVSSNGVRQYRERCVECGESKEAIKYSSLSQKEIDMALEWSDLEAERARVRGRELFYQNHSAIFGDRDAYLTARRDRYNAAWVEHNNQWWAWYGRYMQSDIWRRKRAAVLLRSRNICQACGSPTACQAHHKTYEHVGAEPLFDLAAVCVECHEILTELDRKLRLERKLRRVWEASR